MTRAYDRTTPRSGTLAIVFRINSQLTDVESSMFEVVGRYPLDMYVRIPVSRPHFSVITTAHPLPVDGGPHEVKYVLVQRASGRYQVAFAVMRHGRLYLGWLADPTSCRSSYRTSVDLVLQKLYRFLGMNWTRFVSGNSVRT